MIPAPTYDEQRALIASLAPARLRRFRAAVGGADRAAVELALVDASLASHLHAVLRFLEVALREHLHRALTAHFGPRWFETQRDSFDEDLLRQVETAITRVGVGAQPGQVVAQLMLGAWVAVLGRGGRRPDGTKASYTETLWEPALSPAFPGRTRREVHRIALRLNWARNRINHCEPVVFGFPQPGIVSEGRQLRRSPGRILEDARMLTAALSPELGAWTRRWDAVDTLVQDERALSALDHIATDRRVSLER
ncbi:hypothetical protein [Curtobacterium sp. MCSS17_015]|uniref:hypothetical protein n=1 Tax=Curtobacterium sp. MCSS17_015 TaxID=2175666 RepID=UPI0011B418CF|nr:hypothetical protein [Curtobacterium sp. MCSS17_015]WIB26242.1 hypothetical protein DEJ18_14515 [Curtobacterium sp. MCSS17_015]